MLLILLVVSVVSSQQFTGEEVQNIFGSNKCIQGSLSNINLREGSTFTMKDAKSDYQNLMSNLTHLENQKQADKSVLSKLNEYSQYVALDYYFKLEKEEGLPHEKIFTVSLIIGEEKYVAQGRSIKIAQRNAAALFFENTNYVPLPPKDKSEKIDESLTPTVALNNFCTQMGIQVEYSVIDKDYEILKSNVIISEKSKTSYLQKLNNSLHSNKSIHVKKDLPNNKGPFTIKLQVGENIFYGKAHSIQAAKHDAAEKAIDFILNNKDTLNEECLKEGSEEQCKNRRNNLKSPISIAHEAAQIRGMSFECDVIDESGPAHKKTFVTQCQLGDLSATGEGRSKKLSKKAAAESIVKRIDELPPVSKEVQMGNLSKKKNKKSKKKKKKIIRSNFEEISMISKNFISSAFGYGNIKHEENIDSTENSNNEEDNKKTPKPKYQNKSFQDEILHISNLLNFDLNYSEFMEDDLHFSLLSLHFNPEHLCIGQGLSKLDARNKAAYGALDFLYKLDFTKHFDDKYSSLESNIKASVQTILQAEISVGTE